jgi:hypothetical protein
MHVDSIFKFLSHFKTRRVKEIAERTGLWLSSKKCMAKSEETLRYRQEKQGRGWLPQKFLHLGGRSLFTWVEVCIPERRGRCLFIWEEVCLPEKVVYLGGLLTQEEKFAHLRGSLHT